MMNCQSEKKDQDHTKWWWKGSCVENGKMIITTVYLHLDSIWSKQIFFLGLWIDEKVKYTHLLIVDRLNQTFQYEKNLSVTKHSLQSSAYSSTLNDYHHTSILIKYVIWIDWIVTLFVDCFSCIDWIITFSFNILWFSCYISFLLNYNVVKIVFLTFMSC